MRSMFASSMFLVICVSNAGGAEQDGPAHVARYRTMVAPLLRKYCIDCHGPDEQQARLRLDALAATMPDGATVEVWNKVRNRLIAGEMPPLDEDQPSAAEHERIVGWLARALIDSRRGLHEYSLRMAPRDGNLMDHGLLFRPGAKGRPTASPARLWRTGPHIYWQLILDLDPLVMYDKRNLAGVATRYAQPFNADLSGDFQDYSGTFTIDRPMAALLMSNARTLAIEQTKMARDKEGKLRRNRNGHPQTAHSYRYKDAEPFLPLVDPDAEPTVEQMEAAIRRQFQLVLLREPTPDELARFVAFMQKSIEDAGREEGVRSALAAVFVDPEVFVRRELGAGPVDQYGRRLLGPRELSYAIAYALTDRRPDEQLLSSIEALYLGETDTPAATRPPDEAALKALVRQQATRILDDPKIETPRILRFFREYFNYPRAASSAKDRQTQRAFTKQFEKGTRFAYYPEGLVHDTDCLVEYVLDKDQNVLRELLTTNRAFLNYKRGEPKRKQHGRWSEMAILYNLKERPDGSKQPVSLPSDQRAGVLTQPAWLIAFSFATQNDVMHRGKWVREKLLGGYVPGVPLDVDATIPEAPEKTLRERLVKTKQEYCWSCHKRMNPLGFTFAMYNHFGRFRTEEADQPVDATGAIESSGDKNADGAVENAVAMIRRLADSPRVQQVFVRHAFRYWMGRAETYNDAPTLIAADEAYTNNGGSMRALILSLLTSDSFLYRVPVVENSSPASSWSK